MQRNDARPAPNAGEAKLHFLDYWRVIRVRLGIVILSFLLVLVTAAVTTYFTPRKYKSSTKVELRTDDRDPTVFKGGGGSGGNDSRFMPTQMVIIQSAEVLYPVVDSLGLTRRWAGEFGALPREAAYGKLRGMIGLKPERGTEILDVTVTSTDPRECPEIVNAVLQSYQERRIGTSSDVTNQGFDVLDKDLMAQRKQVADLDKRLKDMLREHPEIRESNPGSVETPDSRQAQIDAKRAEADKFATAVEGLTTQLDKIQQLSGDELIRALATLSLPDQTIPKVYPQYLEARSSEASMLKSGLGVNHPKVASLRATITTYSQQLAAAAKDIPRSLQIQLDVARKNAQTVRGQLDLLNGEQRDVRESSTDYVRLKEDYLKAKSILTDAEMRASRAKMDARALRVPLLNWQKAELPGGPSSPLVWLNMLLGAVVGAIVGIGLAFFIEYLDTSVKTMNDVEALLGVPVLAIIPKDIRLLHKQPGDIPDAEAYRILRTNIEFNRKSADANTISMVSGGPGEGKSTTLANLAYTCAQGGYSVLIVDADLRRPTQHKIFECSNAVGLTNYLTTNIALEDVIQPSAINNLYLMPSGILPADAVGILNSQRMSDMIAELKTRFDIIFFDSPPILGVSDGAVLASEVDQSIIIVQHRRFPRAMLQRVKSAVTTVGGTVLGVVLNNVDLRHDPNYAYYTSYYEYYSPRPQPSPNRERGTTPVVPAPAAVTTVVAPVNGNGSSRNGHDEDHSAY